MAFKCNPTDERVGTFKALGFSNAEIARRFHVSPNRIRQRLWRFDRDAPIVNILFHAR